MYREIIYAFLYTGIEFIFVNKYKMLFKILYASEKCIRLNVI